MWFNSEALHTVAPKELTLSIHPMGMSLEVAPPAQMKCKQGLWQTCVHTCSWQHDAH